MAGYLDRYGEGYAERAKRRKLVLIAVVSMIVATAGLYLALHNHRQKAQVSQFIQLLQKHDY